MQVSLSLLVLGLLLAAILVLQALALRRMRAPGEALERRDLEALRDSLLAANSTQRQELGGALHQTQQTLAGTLTQQIGQLTESNAQRLLELRATVDARLKDLQADNALKLEDMRRTVDEKLQSTLELRLGQSFKLVSERLEQVHKGLGEMQSLAAGVGDLKRVLSNVKTRGMFGEVQLQALLDQVLTAEQYARNVAVRPGSDQRVDFAIRLPGRDTGPVWLPIDAKFPREDYDRLVEAQERADAAATAAAGLALERRVKLEAQTICDKYLAPPHTTDFGILFLPTEGLYAEVLRRPGLVENIQRACRVTVAGPTNLLAYLNSLQMGFRTLAIEQRSSEVWEVLGAVKTEFGRFGEVLDKVKKKLDEAGAQIEQTGVRSRAISRRLRDVEALPAPDAERLLDAAPDSDEPG